MKGKLKLGFIGCGNHATNSMVMVKTILHTFCLNFEWIRQQIESKTRVGKRHIFFPRDNLRTLASHRE